MSKFSIASQSSPRWTTQARAVAVMAAAALFSLTAVSTALAQGAPLKLQDNAPDRYIVEKGDTLWGIANKFLEPIAGAVLGKILLLVFIILFIQKRPRGLFALKGRAVEA